MDDIDYSIQYSRFHDDTEEHAAVASRIQEYLLKPYVPADPNTPILDIGCGFGFALRALRHLGYTNLQGLEMSPQQAERCRKAGFEVTVTNDTIGWLNQNPGRFGFVVLTDVLEHVPRDLQIAFARAVRNVLLPGGKVFITVPNASSILASRWVHNDTTHHSSYTENSLYFVLKNAAFSEIKIDAQKGLGQFSRRLWKKSAREDARKWFIRWCWLQVHKAELQWQNLDEISFELNLKAIATK